jgi:ADP-ribose pyrophosphatase YjhB (NUDIX family)
MPGGHLNEGEDPKKGAVRELLEETGLKPTKLVYLGEKTINDGRLVVYSFRADVDAEPDGSSDPDEECSVWKWVDPEDIPEEILSNLHSRKNVTLEFLREEGSLEKDELWDDGEAEVHHINLANQDDMWVNEFAHGRAK